MNKKSSYQDYLIESLKNPEEAIGYLNASLDGGDLKVFLLALRNVIQARGGIAKIAEQTHKSRTSLYKALSYKGNPYLVSTNDVLGAIGMHLQIVSLEKNRKTKRKTKAA
jgi:probable addiction module antidote protein